MDVPFLQFLFWLQCAGDDFFDVLFMIVRIFLFAVFFFLFAKAVSLLGHRIIDGFQN